MAQDLLERSSRRRPEPGIPFPSGRGGFNYAFVDLPQLRRGARREGRVHDPRGLPTSSRSPTGSAETRSHRLDLSRTPNPHVSFGDGPHICLGAHFARLQLRILHEEARTVLPPYTPAAPPRRLVSNFINGIKSLPLRCD
jgi:hypothetical protein